MCIMIISCQKDQELMGNGTETQSNAALGDSKTEFVYKGKSFIVIQENDKVTTPETAEIIKAIYTAQPNLVVDIFDDQDSKVYLSDNDAESIKIRIENAPKNQRDNRAFKLITQTEINKAIAKYGESGLDLNNKVIADELNGNIKQQLDAFLVDLSKVEPSRADASPIATTRSDVPVASLWEHIWYNGWGVQPLGESDFPSTISFSLSYVDYQNILGQVIGIRYSNGTYSGTVSGSSVAYTTRHGEYKNRWLGNFNDRASSGCFRKYQALYTTHTMYQHSDFGGRQYNVTVNVLNEKCLGDFRFLLWPGTVHNINDEMSSYKISF